MSKRLNDVVPYWSRDAWLIAVILIVGFVLRAWAWWDLPYMHDELSALLRAQVNTWDDFIRTGIILDNHPGGVQWFLWMWTSIGGTAQWWVKAPFILMGVWSIWLTYVVGKRWHSSSTGLMAASLMAVMQFSITFSQWARPYGPGLMLILMLCWLWLKLRMVQRHRLLWAGALGLVLAACGFTHYFALLQAILLMMVWFITSGKAMRPLLILSAVFGALLWLPHLDLTLLHLDRGGIGQWLKPPSVGYWMDLVAYTLHHSYWFALVAAVVLLPGLVLARAKTAVLWRWFWVLLFVMPYMFAYLYSVHRNPLLHQSVMFFALPFFLFWLASFHWWPARYNGLSVAVVLIVGSLTLTLERDHYALNYTSEYGTSLRWLGEEQAADDELSALVSLRPAFCELLVEEQLLSPGAGTWQYAQPLVEEDQLEAWLTKQDHDRLFLVIDAGANPELLVAALEHFPCIDSAVYAHAGEAYLLSRNCDSRTLLKADTDLTLHDENAYDGIMAWTAKEFPEQHNLHLVVDHTSPSGMSVVEVKSSDSTEYWRGVDFASTYIDRQLEQKAYHCAYISELDLHPTDIIKCFLWSNRGQMIDVQRFSAHAVPANPNKFRLFAP